MSEEFNNWPEIAEVFGKATSQVVRKAAFDIQARAQAKAPVDIGFLKGSIYVSTSDSSDYGEGPPPPKGAELLPEQKPEDENTAIIGVGANYGLYVEMGTVHRPATPFFTPAVEAVKPGFEAALGKIEDKLKEIRGS